MKRVITIVIILISIQLLLSREKWEIYTNTTHIFKANLVNNNLVLASWGGLESYALTFSDNDVEFSLLSKKGTIEGISSNEIRDYYLGDDRTWVATYNRGVSIVDDLGIYILNSENGLLSDKVRSIVTAKSLFYVGTEEGISSYYNLEDISFPILNRSYTHNNTLGALLNDDISKLAISGSSMLITSAGGLNYVHIDSLDYYNSWKSINTENSPLTTDEILDVSISGTTVALNTANGIFVMRNFPDNIEWESYLLDDFGHAEISAIYVDSANEIWFSRGEWDESVTYVYETTTEILGKIDTAGNITSELTSDYAFRISGSNGESTRDIDNLGIKNITIDEGKIILSTWGNGLLIKSGDFWYNYKSNGIGFNAITDIKVDHNNVLWASCGFYGVNALRKGTRGVSSFDGDNWTTYNMRNSHLHSDNINSIAVSGDNKKWFGAWDSGSNHVLGWKKGLTSFDDDSSEWNWYTNNGVYEYNTSTESYSDLVQGLEPLSSATVADLASDMHGNIIVSAQSYGFDIYSQDGYEQLSTFSLPNSLSQFARVAFHNSFGYFFSKGSVASGESAGFSHWNSQELPTNDTSANWQNIPIYELRTSAIYDVVELVTPYETQMWVAAAAGLFMYNGEDWYKYGVDIKRYIWQSGWQVETRYFVGEPKMFGAKQTTPKALASDGYQCIWIGTEDVGITKYDANKERFSNYTMEEYPLLSNNITRLVYEPFHGKIYIGTSEGLCSVTVGSSINNQEDFGKVVAFPNPFKPDMGQVVNITNYPSEIAPSSAKICKIYDVSGQLILELPRNKYQTFSWNGDNAEGNKCSSGIYFFVMADNHGKVKRGKIALIRGE